MNEFLATARVVSNMIAALQELLPACALHMPEPSRPWATAVLRPDLAARLAGRLIAFAERGRPIDRPDPQFAEEVTPPLGPVFDLFRPALAAWQAGDANPSEWAAAFAAAGVGGTLLLLGQRLTPASLTDANAIPPTRETLLGSADAPCNEGKVLSVAGRAWAKHAPRSESSFWGTVSGGDAEKNAAARRLLETILDGAGWWNVFGHYAHDTVFEARLPSGHGARWGDRGTAFIGFLEPFLK